ncbi:MAG: anaerobic sulfatase maturase [Phycisphaerae bacterium]|nr:anaerobic sulfatase maturase [Phycisphaerae bacterium]
MAEIVRPFNIMAKPVCGVCNLDCSYCYYTMKPQRLYPEVSDPSQFRMSDAVLEAYTRQYLEAMPARAEFGWQGGEPTLAGLDFFKRAVELQKQYRRDGQVVTNALQTNGTLLDEAWCDFLSEEEFLVGISVDGPPQWHDHYRRDHAGRPTFHRAWAGLERLRDRSVAFNVLVTLNAANAPHGGDIYRYFVNRGVRYLQFIPILERASDGSPAPFSCTGEQFGRFMLDVFAVWVSRDVGRVSERLIDSVLHSLIHGKAAMCCHAPRCANAHVLEWNGDLYACDHFVYPEWKIGNITERPLVELVCDATLDAFAAMKTQLPAACRDCEFVAYCHGGCPKHHRPIGTDPDRVNHFCEGYKMFFREALPELKRLAEYFRRSEMPPQRAGHVPPPAGGADAGFETGPGAAAPQPTRPPTKVGRNDPCPCGSARKFKNCCGRKA